MTRPYTEKLKGMMAIDIETVSQGKVAKDFTDKAYYSPGNAKTEEAIKRVTDKKREEAAHKHGLKWWTGKIISVAVERCDMPEYRQCFYGHNETDVLRQLAASLDKARTTIGMYSKNFDFPFMVGRYMANDLPIPDVLMDRYSQFDTDDMFGYSSASGQRGKLSEYSHGLNLSDKPMGGGDVQKLYDDIMAAAIDQDGQTESELWAKLVNYNQVDTNIVAEMARKYWR